MLLFWLSELFNTEGEGACRRVFIMAAIELFKLAEVICCIDSALAGSCCELPLMLGPAVVGRSWDGSVLPGPCAFCCFLMKLPRG